MIEAKRVKRWARNQKAKNRLINAKEAFSVHAKEEKRKHEEFLMKDEYYAMRVKAREIMESLNEA